MEKDMIPLYDLEGREDVTTILARSGSQMSLLRAGWKLRHGRRYLKGAV